jgi:hypothetical protein
MNDCGAKSKLSGPLIISQKPGTTVLLSIISFKALIPSFRTDLGGILYAKRKSTVEPVYGIIKHVIGFHHFMLRGLQAVPGGMGTRLHGIQSEAPAYPKRGEKGCRNDSEDCFACDYLHRAARMSPTLALLA